MVGECGALQGNTDLHAEQLDRAAATFKKALECAIH